MIREIRIYYETLEQANHFIYPLVKAAVNELNKNIPIKLVKLVDKYTYYCKNIASIIFWKTPDILISVVHETTEYPLILIEFSTAVFTKDHELQRFDGLVAAVKNNAIFVKISPTVKKSPYEHGGEVKFNYLIPFSLIYKKYGKVFFHFEWKCNEEKTQVIHNSQYPSCPHRIVEFEELIKNVIQHIISEGYNDKWAENIIDILVQEPYFKAWVDKLKKTELPDIKSLNTSRTKYVSYDPDLGSEALILKINRFGHAMDPERGMLVYYSTLASLSNIGVVTKMVFDENNDAWFKGISKEREIKNYIESKGLIKACDYLHIFALGTGLYSNEDFKKILKEAEESSNYKYIIDITEFIENNFNKLNKPLKTIFSYSSIFAIEDAYGNRRVILKWGKIRTSDSFDTFPEITPLRERATLDEDDVTYISVHNVLKPNNYRIVSVSYPGAQGDKPILFKEERGRKRQRKYIDIICYLPKKCTNLQENKGAYIREKVQKAIDYLSNYKRKRRYMEALRAYLEKYAPEAIDNPVKIGVGFWASTNFTISKIKNLDLDDLDYFIYISKDRRTWTVWRSCNETLFTKVKGEVKIPKTYEPMKINSMNLMTFFANS